MHRLKRLFGSILVYFGMAMVAYSIYAVFVVACDCHCCANVSFDDVPIRIESLGYQWTKPVIDCRAFRCDGGHRFLYIDAFLSAVALIAVGTLLRRRGKAFELTPMSIAH